MKYKKGDRVRIVSYRTTDMDSNGEMDKYLGTVITIKDIRHSAFISETPLYYEMMEDRGAWYWYDNMIAGLASETPFDFGAWKGREVSMHCKTLEEAEDFCHEMHKTGLTWSSGKSYLEMNCFNVFNEQTCYYFNRSTYTSIGHSKTRGDQILEWSDYRSTEPPKEEQKKAAKIKTDDKPLGYQEAMKIYKRICSSTTECTDCPLDSDNNGIQQPCRYLIRDYPEKAESLLKEWATEHPVKTNEQKCNEMFLETFGVSYAIALAHPDWWQQKYKNINDKITQKENE